MSKLIVSSRYGTTPNEILNSKELSLKAKGLYGFLQCKPDNWNFSTERIASQVKESEKVIRATLQELERFGLLTRVNRPKDKNGKWTGYEYTLHESITDIPKPPLPKAVGRENGNTDLGEDISNKDYSKQDIVINNILADKSAEAETEHLKIKDDVNSILDEFYKFNPGLNFGNKTQRDATQFLINKFGKDELIGMITWFKDKMSDRFCPVATTPLAFKNKLGEIMVYAEKLKQPVKGGITIIQ